VTEHATHDTIRTIVRLEWPKLVAIVTRIVRDVGVAEELAQDALVAALESWPASGIPANPAAWLVTTAKNRAVNHVQRARMLERKHTEIGHVQTGSEMPDPELMIDDVGDEVLRLMFVACHPVLSRDARVSLTLRLLGGLTTDEIARAFLSTEPTIAQRIVRAKKTLAEASVQFEVPPASTRGERVASVCEVIYLVFNEGYAASAGDDAIRPAMMADAMRLGHVLASLVPDDAEVHGLCALMDLHASRARARVDANGDPVLLLDQDRTSWDRMLIKRGLDELARAEALGGGGPYVLQAAASACHARAVVAADTDWAQIAAIYAELARIRPSPVVELNRAMAVAMADGPAAGLAIIDALAGDPALARYHWLPSARADLLVKLGRTVEAAAEFERAAELAGNARDRARLVARAQALRS